MALREISSITVVQSGREAVHTVKDSQPTLIIFDTQLPDEDAWDMIRQVKTICPNAMIVVMIDQIDQKGPALMAGANNVHIKGSSATQLYLALEDLLTSRNPNC